MSGERILGIDIETTGSEFKDDIRLIQIGAFDSETRQLFRMDVGWRDGEFTMVPEATAVHGFAKDRILAASPAAAVDAALVAFLDQLGVGPEQGVAVGFNVGAFDLPFIRRDLPLSGRRFSYRAVDLNAGIFLLSRASGFSRERVKKVAMQAAQAEMSTMVPDLKAHDAGWDAVAAILVFEFIVHAMTKGEGV